MSNGTGNTTSNASLEELGAYLKEHYAGFQATVRFDDYALQLHNQKFAPFIKKEYDAESAMSLFEATHKTRHIHVLKLPHGTFIQAAAFDDADEVASETNYDAVWMRDSVWGHLALASDPARRDDATAVILTQLDYIASQSERIEKAVKNPAILAGQAGHMNAIHIRFNAKDTHFADVLENGKSQFWTHKQNDALGLVLGEVLKQYDSGVISLDELKKSGCGAAAGKSRLDAIVMLSRYFFAVQFWEMEDSGAWEETLRLNTSSVAIVTSALERLHTLLTRDAAFRADYSSAAQKQGALNETGADTIKTMLEAGYARVKKQIALGGESPDYPRDDPRYRAADAALLNLIYPCELSGVSVAEKRRVLEIVGTLETPVGIKRYQNDNYQAANFWFEHIKTDADDESYKKREAAFVPNSEASWFFDSWYARCALLLYEETKDSALRALAAKHTNRALAQITGEATVGADGKAVKGSATPESYNKVIAGGSEYYLPSPITPLNWAKASLTLLLRAWENV